MSTLGCHRLFFFFGDWDVGSCVAGDFHLAADVALMETLSRALATGGRHALRGLVEINSLRHLSQSAAKQLSHLFL